MGVASAAAAASSVSLAACARESLGIVERVGVRVPPQRACALRCVGKCDKEPAVARSGAAGQASNYLVARSEAPTIRVGIFGIRKSA